MEIEKEKLMGAKIALHKMGDRHVLSLRIRCESSEEAARMISGSDQKGGILRTEWKGKMTYYAQWRGRPAGRLLHGNLQHLEGAQLERAKVGIAYTRLIADQWKGHGVGQKITDEQFQARNVLIDKFDAILPQ